jgi:Legume lectin domain
VKRSACFVLFCFSLVLTSLHAQKVVFSGTYVNFGNTFVCPPGANVGFPCGKSLEVDYKVVEAVTFGAPKVLTMGQPNLDFTIESNGCAGQMPAGSSCHLEVMLKPRFAGLRSGAVQLTDSVGNLLVTTFLRGVGAGPQVAVTTPIVTTLAVSANPHFFWNSVAVDGAGNLFYPNGTDSDEGGVSEVFELPVGGGAPKTVGAGFFAPSAVALDGAGNLYVTDGGGVVVVPSGCNSTDCETVLNGGFFQPTGLAVDFAGNVYVVDAGRSRVVELPAGCATPSCAITIGSRWNAPHAIAVDGVGDLFVTDSSGHVEKVKAGNGAQSVAVSNVISYGIAVDAAGDLLLSDPFNGRILQETAGGGDLMTLAQTPGEPVGVAVDSTGNVFVSMVGTNVAIGEIRRYNVPGYTFATSPVGTASSDSPQVLNVQDIGNVVLTLEGAAVLPASSFRQILGSVTPRDCRQNITLAPGASCDMKIRFAPSEPGPQNSAVYLADNNLNVAGTGQVIPLTGIGGSIGPSINFANGFSNGAAGLELSGGATIGNNALQLTDRSSLYETRSVFASTPIGVSSFQTEFDFRLEGDADGFTFALQGNGPNALGSTGGGLGYGIPALGLTGAKIINSVALKFDLHNNNGEGTSSTGLYMNGAAPTTPAINLVPFNIDLHSGHVFHAVLVYDGTTLTFTLTDQVTQATFSTSFVVDIAGFVGGPTAYAGFTASTGMETAVQTILNWQLTSSTCCTAGAPAFSNGFAPASAMALNGSATIQTSQKLGSTGPVLQLTQETPFEVSSAFFTTPVPVKQFTSDFDFVLTRESGDGFTFVLQSQGLQAIGTAGGGLGYGPSLPGGAGPKITSSVAVKFDLHNNAGEGSNSTGVYLGGASPTEPSTNLIPAGINLHGGHTFHARLNYDGTKLTIILTDLTQYAVFGGTYVVDIPAAVGGTSGYAGFTAATGALFDTIKILNWSMTSY